MPESVKPAYIRKTDQRGDFDVWIVDGSYIRGHIDEEFTNFGQHYRYPFIPLKELWIDQEAQHDERRFFMDHLRAEFSLMDKGVPYDKAIMEAEKIERKERRRSGDEQELTHHGRELPDGRDVHERLWKKLESEVSVWIDDAIIGQERPYVLLHELHERNRMSTGWPYSKAHAESSHIEYMCRHHPDELHDALAREGWA
jgi:hypothetical protein